MSVKKYIKVFFILMLFALYLVNRCFLRSLAILSSDLRKRYQDVTTRKARVTSLSMFLIQCKTILKKKYRIRRIVTITTLHT